MNISQVVKVRGKQEPTSQPVPVLKNPQNTEAVSTEKITEAVEKVVNNGIQSMNDQLISIAELITEGTAEEAPEWVKNTQLNNNEIDVVRDFMLDLKEEFFPEMKLERTVPPLFLYNIPRSVFNTALHMGDRYENKVMNPLFWIFMCCVKLDMETYAKIVTTAINNLTRVDMSILEDLAKTEEEDEEEETVSVPADMYEDKDVKEAEEVIDITPVTEATTEFEAEEADPENIEIEVEDNTEVSGEMTELNDDVPPEDITEEEKVNEESDSKSDE